MLCNFCHDKYLLVGHASDMSTTMLRLVTNSSYVAFGGIWQGLQTVERERRQAAGGRFEVRRKGCTLLPRS